MKFFQRVCTVPAIKHNDGHSSLPSVGIHIAYLEPLVMSACSLSLWIIWCGNVKQRPAQEAMKQQWRHYSPSLISAGWAKDAFSLWLDGLQSRGLG